MRIPKGECRIDMVASRAQVSARALRSRFGSACDTVARIDLVASSFSKDESFDSEIATRLRVAGARLRNGLLVPGSTTLFPRNTALKAQKGLPFWSIVREAGRVLRSGRREIAGDRTALKGGLATGGKALLINY